MVVFTNRKIINKFVVDEGRKLERSLMQSLIPRTINDVLQEEIIEIAKDKRINKIDFNLLSSKIPKKCLKVLDEMIKENVGGNNEEN